MTSTAANAPGGEPIALAARGVTKSYGTLVANDNIDFTLRTSEVHALLGENGAGKTTLMRLAFGLETPDVGHFEVFGEQCLFHEPAQAIDSGIGMVHQHFMLVPTMTVAENIVLGQEPKSAVRHLDRRRIARVARELGEEYGLPVNPGAKAGSLAVGEQQRVEILKALYRGAKILILDEPTAVLTKQETDQLFEVIRRLTSMGTSVVIITHKMREVMEIADRVSVLRHGKLVGTLNRGAAVESELVAMMVGRRVDLNRIKEPVEVTGPVRLQVRDLEVDDAQGLRAVHGVSFEVRGGEILGVAGVDGNGQAELVAAIAGMSRPRSGQVLVDDSVLIGGVTDAVAHGVGYIPEDRHRRGLVLPFNLAENLALRRYRQSPITRRGWLAPRRMQEFAAPLLRKFDVRGARESMAASMLSGGNQQKVVIARELEADPGVLIAAQPTRGLDVGAIEFVHDALLEQQREGKAILLLSMELDELRALSDRVVVMYEGRITAELPPHAPEEEFGLAMAGATGVLPT